MSEASKRIRATFGPTGGAVEVPLAEQRRGWEDSAAQTPLRAGATATQVVYDGVDCSWVRAREASAGALLWAHGGGFNAGSAVTHRDLAARLAAATGLPVLLVDYRLAPEHPYPAGRDDVATVYRALLAQGFAPEQLVVGGDSAGGNLAVSALLTLRDGGVALPSAVVLVSAWLDLTLSGDSISTRTHIDPVTSKHGLERAAGLYCAAGEQAEPLASPVFARLAGLPPTLVQVGDHELLLDDSTRFARSAQAAGVDVTLEVWPEMWHVWHSFAAELPEAQQALEHIGDFVRTRQPRP